MPTGAHRILTRGSQGWGANLFSYEWSRINEHAFFQSARSMHARSCCLAYSSNEGQQRGHKARSLTPPACRHCPPPHRSSACSAATHSTAHPGSTLLVPGRKGCCSCQTTLGGDVLSQCAVVQAPFVQQHCAPDWAARKLTSAQKKLHRSCTRGQSPPVCKQQGSTHTRGWTTLLVDLGLLTTGHH